MLFLMASEQSSIFIPIFGVYDFFSFSLCCLFPPSLQYIRYNAYNLTQHKLIYHKGWGNCLGGRSWKWNICGINLTYGRLCTFRHIYYNHNAHIKSRVSVRSHAVCPHFHPIHHLFSLFTFHKQGLSWELYWRATEMTNRVFMGNFSYWWWCWNWNTHKSSIRVIKTLKCSKHKATLTL